MEPGFKVGDLVKGISGSVVEVISFTGSGRSFVGKLIEKDERSTRTLNEITKDWHTESFVLYKEGINLTEALLIKLDQLEKKFTSA